MLRENIKDLDNFYKFELLSFGKSDYFEQHHLYRGNYNIFYVKNGDYDITSCIIFNGKKIYLEYIPFIDIVRQYIAHQLLHSKTINRNLRDDIVLEIENITDFLSSDIHEMIDDTYFQVRRLVENENNEQLEEVFRNTYYRLFNIDIIRLLIRHRLYKFTDTNELFFVNFVKSIDDNVSFDFQPGIHEINNFISYFDDDLRDIINYSYPKYYPYNTHDNLSFGGTIVTILNLIDNDVYLSEIEEIQNQVDYYEMAIQEKLFNKNQNEVLKQEVKKFIQKKNTIDIEINKVKKIINNPNALYPMYIIYNDIRDFLGEIEMRTNQIEFLDNDLYNIEKVIRHAEKHKKRNLMSLENDINFIETNINNTFYVDNEIQMGDIRNKLFNLKQSYTIQQRDYNDFTRVVKNVLFNKNVYKSPRIFPVYTDKLLQTLAKELESFYNIQKIKIDKYIQTGKIIDAMQKHLISDDEQVKQESYDDIVRYQEKINDKNVKLQKYNETYYKTLNELATIYKVFLDNGAPTTTFASSPEQPYSITRFLDF